jgi:EmrB/QacA subfamily drug resistance transporter
MISLAPSPCDEALLRAGKTTAPCTKAAGRWILAATILASSMVFIDGTVVNVALPALQTSLNATVRDVQWVVESYALLLAALLLVGGSLGDHYGRRRIFIMGVILFALASAWCGFAPDVRQLILARGIQGLGAALLVPGSLAIISASFSDEERGRAIGTWSGATAITAAVGPVLGGWLIEHVSWRAIFFINLPLAFFVAVVSVRHVPESHDQNVKGGLDWLGAILTVGGLGSIVYGLLESSGRGLKHPSVLAALFIGTFFLFLFLVREVRTPNPMLPLSLFRSRDFSGANLLTFFLYSALSGALFFLPLNLIQVHGYTPTAAGAALLPFILIIFSLSRWAGGLVKRYGAKAPLVIGPALAAFAFVLFMLPGGGGTYFKTFLPAVVLLGVGMAVSVAPLTTTVMNSVPENRVGIASGINNSISRTGGLLAIAVLGIVMVTEFNRGLDQRLPPAQTTSEAVRQTTNEIRTKMAGVLLPQEIDPATRAKLKSAINDSFVMAFRHVMFISALLGIASSISAVLLIGNKSKKRQA